MATIIRDPQTDVSTADYSIGGTWEFDNKLTYTSSLGFTANTDIVDKQYVDSRVVGAVNEDNIYYIGQHGNDSGNDGQNIEEAFLTIQKGIDEAALQSPVITSQYAVKINDGGSYDSFTFASKPYIHLDAPSAQLQSTSASFVLGSENSVLFDKAAYNAGGGILFTKGGTNPAYLTGNEIFGGAVAVALEVTQGTLYANVSHINITTTNEAIRTRNGTSIYLKSQDIKGKIILDSTSSANIVTHTQDGDIEVPANSTLTMIVNGEFTGNITTGDGATIRLLVGDRTAGYNDSHHPNAVVLIDYIGHSLEPHKNLLVGADYSVNPRQETPSGSITGAANDTYIADNTIYLASNPNVVNVATSSDKNLLMDTNVTGHRFGIVIPVENNDTLSVLEDVVSISLKAAWVAGNVYDLRMAVISWDGAGDFFTSDVVASWAATPTLATNWTYENTPVDLTMTSLGAFHTHKIENIPIDTPSTTNIAVFVWTPYVQTAIGDTLEITNIRCNQGKVAEDISPRLFQEELNLCERYYSKSYDLTTAPGTATFTGSQSVNKGAPLTTAYVGMNVRFPTHMLKAPQLTPYSPNNGAIDNIYLEGSGNTAASSARVGSGGGQIVQDTPASGTYFASYHWVADGRF